MERVHELEVEEVLPADVGDEVAADVPATLPGAPAPAAFADDEGWHALRDRCAGAVASLRDRQWDNLAHIEAFAAAAPLAHHVVQRFAHDEEARRAVVHALWPLLPTAARARAFLPLPTAVAARGPDFRIGAGDVPQIAAPYASFLERDDVIPRLFVPGAGPFLVNKSVCPAAARGSATVVILDEASREGMRAHVPRHALEDDAPEGARYDVRTGPDKKPLLSVEGKSQPILVTAELLGAWLFSAGPDARGLDLRSHHDRALLLVWTHLLRHTDVRGRSAFAWLEDAAAPRDVRVEVVTACIHAAAQAVWQHAACPVACRIALRPHDNDHGWPQRAAALLDDTHLFRDVSPRVAPVGFARDVVWLDALLPSGFAAGRLSPVAAGRAFARLATSVLAPLGVLPLSGLKDGSGAVLLQRLVPDDDDGALHVAAPMLVTFGSAGAITPLLQAWRRSEGLLLPDPRGAPRHDVQQMPAWLSFFLEGAMGLST